MPRTKTIVEAPKPVPLLNVPDVANWLRCSRDQIYDLVKEEKIPHIRIDGSIRFNQGELEEWLKKNSVSAVIA